MASPTSYTFVIENPSPPVLTATVIGSGLRVSWVAVDSDFPVTTYIIYSGEGIKIGETDGTYYDVLEPSGTVSLFVEAVDSGGNASERSYIAYTVAVPSAPTISARVSDDKRGVLLTWTNSGLTLPLVGYDVVRQWTVDGATYEEEYGRIDVDMYTAPAVLAGTHTYMVRAIDSSGQKSGWGYVDFLATGPSIVQSLVPNTIRNNVQITWSAPTSNMFAIEYYVLWEVAYLDDGALVRAYIARLDSEFSSFFENAAGDYYYGVEAVDVAGNIGTLAVIGVVVTDPPDYVSYADVFSTFNGELTNALLNGTGGMILPVKTDETWAENIERGGFTTWQSKIDGDALGWLSPEYGTGIYVEEGDLGDTVSSTKLTVTPTYMRLSGNPVISCKIEKSIDGEDWEVVSDGAFYAIAAQFRYVRYTITVTGGQISMTSLQFQADVEKKNDSGRVTALATDGPDTGDDAGTWVPFNVEFVDVQSGPICSTADGRNYVVVNFADVISPEGFRVLVFDTNNQRIDAVVNWSATGV